MKPEYTSEAMAKAAGFDTEYTQPKPSPKPSPSPSAPLPPNDLAGAIFPHLIPNRQGKPK